MNHDMLVMLNEGGTKLSEMDEHFGEATEQLQAGDTEAAQKALTKGHLLLGTVGLVWARVALAATGGDTKARQTVGDVSGGGGDEQFTGSVDPASLSVNNWAYFQRRNLGSRAGEIFSGSLSGLNAALGKYHSGDLATAKPEAGPLAAFG